MKLAVVIPTYQRTRKLKRCINAILNGTYKNLQVVVYADAGDLETSRFVKQTYHQLPVKCIVNQERKYVIGSWNHFAKYHISSYDCMAWIVDDVEVDKDCFTEAIVLMQSEFPDTDGMIGITQNYPGHPEVLWRENGQCVIGKKFIQRFPDNQVCATDYIHFYQDEEVLEYAKSINKFRLSSGAHLIHYHPAFYPNELDATHRIVRGSVMAKDAKTHRLRQERGLIWGKSWELINV